MKEQGVPVKIFTESRWLVEIGRVLEYYPSRVVLLKSKVRRNG